MNKMALLTATLSILAIAGPAHAESFTIAEDNHTVNEVSFTSIAPLVRMVGRTQDVTGQADIDINRPAAAKGRFVVDLSSLQTGIKRRDAHMRDMIEVTKFPTAVLEVDRVEGAPKALEPGKTAHIKAVGRFTIHGVTRDVTVPGQITFLPETKGTRDGNWVLLESRFPLLLVDYGIALPKPLLGIKVADTVTIDVSAMARAGVPQAGKQ
ncbi:MAG: YceI family protein [Candidatus Sericytochromatia bacterium]|nr:YceI family protein [Candidatus Tanganyikabacteria bacterium]